MAQGYVKAGVSDTEACFHLSFRDNPFGGGYSLACGLEQALDYLEALSFSAEDVAYLATLTGNDGAPLFAGDFLEYLELFRFEGNVDAIPEGTAVFPHEPLLRVSAPIVACQIAETALLNIINFQTLVATKATRVCEAAGGDPVIEFGLRRAQGPDGGLSAARAAFVGGCRGTSNVLAGSVYGIPVSGTHAHSWVMLFPSEAEAFRAYAEALPNNATFLVDTYDTLAGVRRAAEEGRRLRERGYEMIGVRIDSGDLAWLSREARAILDEAGFPEARIVASNELDEHLIASLKDQDAAIDFWGVGTRLVTAHDQPALGGVYKLSAIRRPGGEWEPRIKISEQTAKVTMPGVLGVRRYFDAAGRPASDMIYDVTCPLGDEPMMIDPVDSTRRRRFSAGQRFEDLLVPVMCGGERVYESPPLPAIAERAREQIALLGPSVRRFLNPHFYPVGLERGVHARRMRLIVLARAREGSGGATG
ncbi:MAG: nicotinate phosphoribosyltransferase [Coriobacteriia bacterium]|nr:nicotinate phosphoribosyltransferase [Coriobacteriia bacterium]